MTTKNKETPILFNSSNSSKIMNKQSSSPHYSDVSIAVSAPGKIILHGEHSVVYGKLAVAASLGLRTNVTLDEVLPCHDQHDVIHIEFPALNLSHSYSLNEVSSFLNKPLPLLKSSSEYNWEKPELINHEELVEMVEEFVNKTAGPLALDVNQKLSLCCLFYLFTAIVGVLNRPLKPFRLKLDTDLTVSSGSGSSASFAVTLAAAFLQYVRTKLSEAELKDILKIGFKSTEFVNYNLKQFNDAELELISKWAFLTEKIIHGTPSGIDNAICTYGSVVEFRKSTGPKLLQLSEFQLILVNTKVKRDTKQLVKVVVELKQRHPKLVEIILNGLDEIADNAVDCLKHLSDFKDSTNVEPLENQQDKLLWYSRLAELTTMNQHLLQALGASHPSLDRICAILKKWGLSGKLTGAGGGGYAIALVPSHIDREKIAAVLEELNSQGFDAILTNLGGPGITIDM